MSEHTPQSVIDRIAQVAHAVAWQAGVGGMEIAGQIISVLARHPELTDRFMAEGAELMIEGLMGVERGCLTFHNAAGVVTTPEQLSASREIHKIKKAAGVAPFPPNPTP